MNLLDVLLMVAFSYALVRGFLQGALSQMAAFAGSAVGLLLGAAAAPPLAAQVIDRPGATLALLTISLLAVFLVLGQAAGIAVGLRLRGAAERAGIGGLDRGVGILVGATWFVLVVWLTASVLTQGPFPSVAQQVRSSRVVAGLDAALPPAPDLFGRVGSYLDRHGFPQVFSGLQRGVTAPPVGPTSEAAVQAAAAAGRPAAVQVQALGCGGISYGSGFVARAGIVVTNAHVVAGAEAIIVRDAAGDWQAAAIHYDPELDLAVLAAPGLRAAALEWADEPAERDTEGATLGFPGGQTELVVRPATVQTRIRAVGRDIYGAGQVEREVLVVSAGVEQGDSGGPFVTSDGRVAGVVFAADAGIPGTGYALTAEQVAPAVNSAAVRNTAVGTGSCRF